jgi:hypothetical protein
MMIAAETNPKIKQENSKVETTNKTVKADD